MMEAFAAALLDSALPPPPGLKAWNGSDPAARFAVYRNNVVVSLIDALSDAFPVVSELVGAEFFAAMAHEYARRHPPSSPVLAHYGEGFPEFVSRFEPAASLPYLPDVARLEWAYVHAFHAADADALAIEALRELLQQPEALLSARLQFAPAVTLIRSNFAVVSIWHAHQRDGGSFGIDWTRPEAAFVARPGLEVEIIPLAPDAARFLDALMNGSSLGAAYEYSGTGKAADLEDIFSLLLRTHALKGFEILHPPEMRHHGKPAQEHP